MTNEELNNKIRKVCDDTEHFECFGGKSIPYIGWFWRDVDFDNIVLGVFEEGKAFMENNKWDYDEIYPTAQECERIKNVAQYAVTNPSFTSFKCLYDTIQQCNGVDD